MMTFGDMYNCAHTSTICNSQHRDTIQTFINSGMGK